MTTSPDLTGLPRHPAEGLPEFRQDFAGGVPGVDHRLCGFGLNAISSDATSLMNASISLAVTLGPSLDDHQAEEHLRALHAELWPTAAASRCRWTPAPSALGGQDRYPLRRCGGRPPPTRRGPRRRNS
ncbi:hypothetical protein [uncultured Propionibacterium sp.]|uniref:hypothetical protein n=1 Tax=uncultured Propionibacterium sp. TaxID=218066 RepID=UPI0029308AAA|nr:hypothetical protein [uncultured Propionibacterium sp.]